MTTEHTNTPKDRTPQPPQSNGHATPEPKPPSPLSADASRASLAAAAAGDWAKDEALPIELATVSDDVLAALADEVPREIARRKARREAEFFALIDERARMLNIPPAKLAAVLRARHADAPGAGSAHDGRSVVVPKYLDPATGATWSGRGEAPPWVEFGPETLPPSKPGGRVRRVPLKKFWISEQEKK
jgi:DNA-binding protein H-NS